MAETVWDLVTKNSTLRDEEGNSLWDHLNNLNQQIEEGNKTCGVPVSTLGASEDPDLNSPILSAQSGLGGIAVSWTYPAINPQAVAHTAVYRNKSAAFESAALVATVGGNYYFDRIDVSIGTEYFYWIQVFSVTGTEGDILGPVSATLQPSAAQLIEILQGKIDNSALNQDLKTEIDTIGDFSSGLSAEEQQRLFGDDVLDQLMAQTRVDLNGVDALIKNEVSQRISSDANILTQINAIGTKTEENEALVTDLSFTVTTETDALASEITTASATAADNLATAQEELIAYADSESAAAKSISTLEITVGENTAAVQETSSVLYGAEGLTAQHMVKTDVNGFISGYGLYNDGNTSAFIVNADLFAIGPGAAAIEAGDVTAEDTKNPFIIGEVNGETQIALNARTLIPDAQITNAMIENNIQSVDYNPGVSGWSISKNIGGNSGYAEFQNVVVRGDVEATSIKANTVAVDTLNIAGNAVTVPVHSNTGSSTYDTNSLQPSLSRHVCHLITCDFGADSSTWPSSVIVMGVGSVITPDTNGTGAMYLSLSEGNNVNSVKGEVAMPFRDGMLPPGCTQWLFGKPTTRFQKYALTGRLQWFGGDTGNISVMRWAYRSLTVIGAKR